MAKQNQQTTRPLTFNEAVKVFGKKSVIAMCDNKIEEATKDTREMRREIRELETKRATAPYRDLAVYELMVEHKGEQLEKKKKEIKQWKYRKAYASGDEKAMNSYVDKEELKQIPLARVMANLGYKEHGRSQGRSYYKIRQEKTASCVVFHNTNSFYDFGASIGGDSISLIQILYGCNFGQACKILKDMI